MENQFLDQDVNPSINQGLSIEDRAYLLTAAKWARFLGIIGFIATGLILLAAFFMMTMGSALGGGALGSLYGTGFGLGLGVFYLAIAAPYFFISLFMYRFGSRVKDSQFSSSNASMTEAFKNLKQKQFISTTHFFLCLCRHYSQNLKHQPIQTSLFGVPPTAEALTILVLLLL